MQQLRNEQLPLAVPKPSKEERRNHSPICDLERKGQYIPLSSGERRVKIAKKIATRGLIGVALTTEILSGALLVDGYTQIYELSQTKPSITEVAESANPDNADTVVVYAIGFGGLTAVKEAKGFTPYLSQFGRVLAVNYDDGGIDFHQLTEVIGKEAEAEGATKVIFAGDSLGNSNEVAIAPDLLKGGYGITDIPAFIINSGPSGVDGLREQYIHEGKEQTWLHNTFPVAAKGKLAREAVELYIRRNQYISSSIPDSIIGGCGMAVTIFNDTIISPVAASNQLLNSEFEEFASTDQEQKIRELGQFEEEHHVAKTSWYYIGAANDYIVNTNYSSKKYDTYIKKAGFSPLNRTKAPGIIHGEPDRTPKLYQKIFSRLVPNIKRSIAHEQAVVAPHGHHQVIVAEENDELNAAK